MTSEEYEAAAGAALGRAEGFIRRGQYIAASNQMREWLAIIKEWDAAMAPSPADAAATMLGDLLTTCKEQ